MDRYLFKAKRIDNGEWVQGNLILSNDAEDGYRAIIIPTNNSNMFTKSGAKENLGFENWYRVNENTLCQCTGLKDKNGNLIWENDIGRYQWDGKTKTDVIVYDGSMFTYSGSMRWDLCQDEMIGNIFDNPELLEEKETSLDDEYELD